MKVSDKFRGIKNALDFPLKWSRILVIVILKTKKIQDIFHCCCSDWFPSIHCKFSMTINQQWTREIISTHLGYIMWRYECTQRWKHCRTLFHLELTITKQMLHWWAIVEKPKQAAIYALNCCWILHNVLSVNLFLFSHKYCLPYVLDAQPSDLSYRQLL